MNSIPRVSTSLLTEFHFNEPGRNLGILNIEQQVTDNVFWGWPALVVLDTVDQHPSLYLMNL
ncbi:MAG: hypothetical protein F4X92_04010 [Gammaproteobacteria bacterium]|nr:hypothetical protein [Gammaproteobacteria bacterium]